IYNGSQNWIRGFIFGSDESLSANSWGGPQVCHFKSDTTQLSSNNKITNNWFGLSSTGDSIESNLTTPGISLEQGASFNLIEQNTICAYGLPLILSGPGEINSVKGNLIDWGLLFLRGGMVHFLRSKIIR
ncbi:MAG TPA: hypothetical protein PKZ53_12355, partial [Acidobacteriota bacterium]|nr:hypothetical protein [Acidobacteriota bacterium]